MAISNSKPLLFQTQNPFSSLLTIFIFFLLLLNQVKSESFSFSFSVFEPDEKAVIFLGAARPSGGVIQLTRRDNLTLRQHSVGRAIYFTPVHIWDSNTGKLADFTTEFSYVRDSVDPVFHGDGLAFFLAPFNSAFHIPTNSTGGYLGLFSPKTAFNQSQNRIVAIELDSFGNEWDPVPVAQAAHVGIDINSLKSVKFANWPINQLPTGAIGKARISYDSKAKELSVLLSYTNVQPNILISLSQTIDLRSVLPEWVAIGFSAATGDEVETHDILSWSFSLNL